MRHVTLLDAEGVYRKELLSILEEIDIHYTVVENYDLSTVYDGSDLVILVCKYEMSHISSEIRDANERFLIIMYDIPIRSAPRLMGGVNSRPIFYYLIHEINDGMRDELKLIINGAIDRFDRRLGKRLGDPHV